MITNFLHSIRARSVLLTGTLLLGLGLSAWAQTNVTTYATGLEFPRGLKFGPDGDLYVAEAGAGGSTSTDGMCDQVIPPVGPYTGGFTGRVSKVTSDGTVTTVADNLPSQQNVLGDVSGPADVGFIGRTLYVLDNAGCSHGDTHNDAAILRIAHDGSFSAICNLSVFQQSHPVANPNPADFEPDGEWYSMVVVGQTFYALEPNHGELDSVQLDGRIKRVIDISASQGHVVPSALAFDGRNFYEGNLGLFPITQGSQTITKITPTGKSRIVVNGLTNVLGVAFDRQGGLYALESSVGVDFPTPGTGKVVKVNRDGSTEDIATDLSLPTAITFGPDGNLYISNWGFGPPGMGEILKVTLP
ncbi:MAG: ScyD/ScyE family protein [Spartobacteria bacterium]